MMNDVVGQHFGRLIVVSLENKLSSSENKNRMFANCRCDCGFLVSVRLKDVVSGNTSSCGCLRREKSRDRSKTHGMYNSISYASWKSMIERIKHPESYREVYSRIDSDERWERFENFFEDMGERPSKKYSIDRIDNSKGYYKENCRWATSKEQNRNSSRNRLIEFNGETYCLAEWEERTGLDQRTIRLRLHRGWSVERALTEPMRQVKQ